MPLSAFRSVYMRVRARARARVCVCTGCSILIDALKYLLNSVFKKKCFRQKLYDLEGDIR